MTTALGELLLLGMLAPATLNRQLSAENETWRTEVVHTEGCSECLGGRVFRIACTRRETGKGFRVEVRNATKALHRLALFQDRLVVLGELPHGGDVMTVLDLARAEVIDEVYAYHAALSESHRLVAFRKFYPRFAPPEAVTSTVLVYDIGASPLENRSLPELAGNPEEAGVALFPPEAGRPRARESRAPTPRYSVEAGPVWAVKADVLGMVVREGQKRVAVVVRIDTAGKSAEVCSRGLQEPAVGSGDVTVVETLRVSLEGVVSVGFVNKGIRSVERTRVWGACEERFTVQWSSRIESQYRAHPTARREVGSVGADHAAGRNLLWTWE